MKCSTRSRLIIVNNCSISYLHFCVHSFQRAFAAIAKMLEQSESSSTEILQAKAADTIEKLHGIQTRQKLILGEERAMENAILDSDGERSVCKYSTDI